MYQELVTQEQVSQQPAFPRTASLSGNVNHGAVAIEQERAVAEAQGQLILAKKFPRDLNAAHAELMAACKSKAFAAAAFYSKPQGGSKVTGPSIRMAEEVARVYGNVQYGHRELSRDDKKSEVEVFFWDMEKNNYVKRQKTVMHVRDTKEGPKKFRDQTDIDQKINNVASKEVRGLILAGVAKWLIADAIEECKKTITGDNDEPLDVRVRKMTQAFAKYGVKVPHLEKYLGHTLDEVLLDELVDLMGVFNSLRDGTPASDIFGDEKEADAEASAGTAAKLADSARAGAAAKPKATRPAAAASQSKTEDSKTVKEPSKPVEESNQVVNDVLAAAEAAAELPPEEADPAGPAESEEELF